MGPCAVAALVLRQYRSAVGFAGTLLQQQRITDQNKLGLEAVIDKRCTQFRADPCRLAGAYGNAWNHRSSR